MAAATRLNAAAAAAAASLAFLSLRGIFFRRSSKRSSKTSYLNTRSRLLSNSPPAHLTPTTTTVPQHVVRHHQHPALRVRQLPKGLHVSERRQELHLHQEVRLSLRTPGRAPAIECSTTSTLNEVILIIILPQSSSRLRHQNGDMSKVVLSMSSHKKSARLPLPSSTQSSLPSYRCSWPPPSTFAVFPPCQDAQGHP